MSVPLSVLCAAFLLLVSPKISAQTQPMLTGNGQMHFEMIGPEETPDVMGHWTLIRPNNERTEGDAPTYAFSGLTSGNYTFSTTLPQGASVIIEVYENDELTKTIKSPQASFAMHEGVDIFLKIAYAYTRTGKVIVNSDPAGLAFSIKGPNNLEERGVTPASYEGYPEGQYTAYFDEIEGCPMPPAQSGRMQKDGRISLQVNIQCANIANTNAAKDIKKTLEFVSVILDGKSVTFNDVRLSDWFAPYVSIAAKAGVLSGYKDENDQYNGMFGPGDNVTIAQLSKIAHKVAGIDETKMRAPTQNSKAKGQWFEFYFASAEQQWWEVWRDKWLDPSRPANRGEVIETLLRAFNVRTVWAQGKTFDDVLPTYKYANAIETAAADGLIDTGGNFRPDDLINRAEVAKMIKGAIDVYIENTQEIQGGSW